MRRNSLGSTRGSPLKDLLTTSPYDIRSGLYANVGAGNGNNGNGQGVGSHDKVNSNITERTTGGFGGNSFHGNPHSHGFNVTSEWFNATGERFNVDRSNGSGPSGPLTGAWINTSSNPITSADRNDRYTVDRHTTIGTLSGDSLRSILQVQQKIQQQTPTEVFMRGDAFAQPPTRNNPWPEHNSGLVANQLMGSQYGASYSGNSPSNNNSHPNGSSGTDGKWLYESINSCISNTLNRKTVYGGRERQSNLISNGFLVTNSFSGGANSASGMEAGTNNGLPNAIGANHLSNNGPNGSSNLSNRVPALPTSNSGTAAPIAPLRFGADSDNSADGALGNNQAAQMTIARSLGEADPSLQANQLAAIDSLHAALNSANHINAVASTICSLSNSASSGFGLERTDKYGGNDKYNSNEKSDKYEKARSTSFSQSSPSLMGAGNVIMKSRTNSISNRDTLNGTTSNPNLTTKSGLLGTPSSGALGNESSTPANNNDIMLFTNVKKKDNSKLDYSNGEVSDSKMKGDVNDSIGIETLDDKSIDDLGSDLTNTFQRLSERSLNKLSEDVQKRIREKEQEKNDERIRAERHPVAHRNDERPKNAPPSENLAAAIVRETSEMARETSSSMTNQEASESREKRESFRDSRRKSKTNQNSLNGIQNTDTPDTNDVVINDGSNTSKRLSRQDTYIDSRLLSTPKKDVENNKEDEFMTPKDRIFNKADLLHGGGIWNETRHSGMSYLHSVSPIHSSAIGGGNDTQKNKVTSIPNSNAGNNTSSSLDNANRTSNPIASIFGSESMLKPVAPTLFGSSSSSTVSTMKKTHGSNKLLSTSLNIDASGIVESKADEAHVSALSTLNNALKMVSSHLGSTAQLNKKASKESGSAKDTSFGDNRDHSGSYLPTEHNQSKDKDLGMHYHSLNFRERDGYRDKEAALLGREGLSGTKKKRKKPAYKKEARLATGKTKHGAKGTRPKKSTVINYAGVNHLLEEGEANFSDANAEEGNVDESDGPGDGNNNGGNRRNNGNGKANYNTMMVENMNKADPKSDRPVPNPNRLSESGIGNVRMNGGNGDSSSKEVPYKISEKLGYVDPDAVSWYSQFKNLPPPDEARITSTTQCQRKRVCLPLEATKISYSKTRCEKGWADRQMHVDTCKNQRCDDTNRLAWQRLATANEYAAAMQMDSV